MNPNKPHIRLRIGGVPEHFNLPWRLAIESGSLKQYDVKASWTDFHSGTGEMIYALNNDEIDMATLLTEGAVAALAKQSSEDIAFELFAFYTKTPLIWGVHIPAQSSIQSLDDIANATFVISRYGSGSHLMAYLLAESLGHDTDKLNFKVINNLEGARQLFADGGDYVFLWEKFMTKPYVDNNEMQRIADFPTPWSCFVTCVRKSVLQQHPKQVEQVMQSVLGTANDLKKSPITEKLIASHYQLELEDVTTWLKNTEWHRSIKLNRTLITDVEDKLRQLKII